MKPYGPLAPIYDQVMSHVSYDRWYRYILEIDQRFPFPSRQVLEIGGGTGKLASLFMGTKYKWFFSDGSPAMVEQAKQRLSTSIPVFAQDARYPAVSERFGLVVFLYDGINYMLTSDDFVTCLNKVLDCLVPKGYFLFDVTTETNSLAHFQDYTCFEDFEDVCYVRRSFYEKATRTQHNLFDIFQKTKGDLFERRHESHEQKVFSLAEICQMTKLTDFRLKGIWDGYGFRKASHASTRVHFFLQKP